MGRKGGNGSREMTEIEVGKEIEPNGTLEQSDTQDSGSRELM